MKRITDPTFRYYSSADTSVARTFARIRKQQKADTEAAKVNAEVAAIARGRVTVMARKVAK